MEGGGGAAWSISEFASRLRESQTLLILFVSTTGDGEHTVRTDDVCARCVWLSFLDTIIHYLHGILSYSSIRLTTEFLCFILSSFQDTIQRTWKKL